MSGSTLEKIKSRFWLQGSYLSDLTSSWPTKPYASLILYQTPTANNNKISCITINQLTDTITEYLVRTGSYNTVLNTMCFLRKATRAYKHHSAPILPWNNVWNYISSSIISCFNPSTEAYIAKNKLKHLLIQPQDRIYYVSVPLICGKSLLASCIMQDAHNKLGHTQLHPC